MSNYAIFALIFYFLGRLCLLHTRPFARIIFTGLTHATHKWRTGK